MRNEQADLRRAWLALLALALGFSMTMLDQVSVAVALPAIAAAWDVSYATAVWVSSAYLLAVVVPLLATGRMGDRFGLRRMFLAGVVVFTVFATASAMAPSFSLLLLARFLQGLGAAMLLPQTLAIITQVFPQQRRGTALGVWGVVGAITGMFAPILAGYLVGSVGWRWIFLLHLPLGLIALAAGWAWVPRLPVHPTSIDVFSVVLSFVGIGALVYAIQGGLNSPELWIAGVVGVVATAGFFLRQRRAGALVPLRLFRGRNFVVGTGTIMVMGALASAQFIPLMTWLQDDVGLSVETAGLVATPMAVVGFFMGLLGGWLSDRVRPAVMHRVGFGILALSLLIVVVLMRGDDRMPGLIAAVLAAVVGLGVGQSFIWASNAAAVFGEVDPADMGAASGAYNMSRQLGGVLGVAVVGAILAGFGPAAAMAALAALVVVGFVAAGLFSTAPVQPEH
ncbi:MFS transporter [Corynebacterium doosanense]|uniref:Membrane protein n=1 Tax=Corynebacterium doosanense CAU 212 = DSM 45436 TaxID=558173 RepID=A0A097IFJ4_9CORY|nr:MFS transporter [Corynebacterium doosanense]AIT60898.1 membrane protein [Corynebacterium doosanense CAU 212 = DSM 45436]